MKRKHNWRRINHILTVVLEISKKRSRRRIDWYKSKHRTSEYFGSPIMKDGKVVRRWDLEATG